MKLYIKESFSQYREATETEIRNAFKELADKKAEEARRKRMTDAERVLEDIKAAGLEEEFEAGNKIIRERDNWKQGGSMLGLTASYEYWDGSQIKWYVPHIHPPYWGLKD